MTEGSGKTALGERRHALAVLQHLGLAAVDEDERAPRVADVQRLVVLVEDQDAA